MMKQPVSWLHAAIGLFRNVSHYNDEIIHLQDLNVITHYLEKLDFGQVCDILLPLIEFRTVTKDCYFWRKA